MVRPQIVLPTRDCVGSIPQWRVGELCHRRRLKPMVELRDLQQLEAQLWPTAVAGHQRGAGSQSTTSALTGNRNALGVNAQLRNILGQPQQRRIAIVDSRGEGIFGSQPVLHRHHHRRELSGHTITPRVHHLDRPEHEPSTVDLQHCRQKI